MEEIALKEEPAAEQPAAPAVPLVAEVPVAEKKTAELEVVEEHPAEPEIPETHAEPEAVEEPVEGIPAMEEEPVVPEVVEQPAEPEISETHAEPEAVEEPVEEIPAVEEESVTPEVVEEQPAEPEIPETPAEPEEVETPVVEEETVETEVEDEAEPSEEKPHRKRSRWWLWLLIVLVILAAAGAAGYLYRAQIADFVHPYFEKFGWCKSEQPVQQPTENPAIVSEPEETTLEVDTLQQETDTLTEQLEEPQPEPVAEPFDINNMRHITFEKGKFYVIHGSLPSDADCAKHVKQACLQKYNPSILCTPGDWHRRVCLGVFSNEADAERFAAGIHNAWVKSE